MKKYTRMIALAVAALMLVCSFAAFGAVTEVDENAPMKDIKVTRASNYPQILKYMQDYLDKMDHDYILYEYAVEEDGAVDLAAGATNSATRDPSPNEAPAAEQADEGSAEKDHSTTNVQEIGVDEPDVVKTDGEYIYYLRRSGGGYRSGYKLSIVKADADGNSKEVTAKTYASDDGYLYDATMYIKGDRLVVMFSESLKRASQTTIIIYDITNKAAVRQARSFVISGSTVTSRLKGDNLYLVTNHYINKYGKDAVAQASDLPYMEQNGVKTALPANSFYLVDDPTTLAFTNVVGLNITANAGVNICSLSVPNSEVYMSQDNLYTYRTSYRQVGGTYRNVTDIFKFAVASGRVDNKAAGTVRGYLLNQYAMSERNGDLRVATTNGWGSSSGNNLYVLSSALKAKGAVEGLAPGETIYSVRYSGAMAYMVTFRQTDPLYAIDLSDPAKPEVKGKLKIPGFSNYMHPVLDDKVIGFGRDADDEGVTSGLKLSMFDVANANEPKQLATTLIGGNWSSSPLQYNYTTMIINEAEQFIGFPVTLYSITSKNTPKAIRTLAGKDESFNGFLVYQYSEKGFKLLCAAKGESPYETVRGIYIGDCLYTMSENVVAATRISTGKTIGKLELK